MGKISRYAAHQHTILRLAERYGIIATHDDLNAMTHRLHRGEISPAYRQGKLRANGTGGWSWLVCIPIDGKLVGFVYGPNRRRFVTALPPTEDGGFSRSTCGTIRFYPPDHPLHVAQQFDSHGIALFPGQKPFNHPVASAT